MVNFGLRVVIYIRFKGYSPSIVCKFVEETRDLTAFVIYVFVSFTASNE